MKYFWSINSESRSIRGQSQGENANPGVHHLRQDQQQHHGHRPGQLAGTVLRRRNSAIVLYCTDRQLLGSTTQSATPSLLNHHHPGKIHWPLGQKSHIRRHGLQPPDPICVWGTRHGRHHQRQDLTNRGHQHCTS